MALWNDFALFFFRGRWTVPLAQKSCDRASIALNKGKNRIILRYSNCDKYKHRP